MDLTPLSTTAMSWLGLPFPDRGSAILSQHESAIVLNPTGSFSIFETNIWGMLFYGTKIEKDHNKTQGVHLHVFAGLLLLFVEHAGKMLQLLGYSAPIHMEIAVYSLLRVAWLNPQLGGSFEARPGSELDDAVRFSVTTTTEAMRNEPDGVVMNLLRHVFFAVNWSGLIDSQEKLNLLVRAGRTFNR